MKVLIVSKPRMGSTVFGSNLSKLYRLDYYNEPTVKDGYVFEKDNCLIKIVVGNISTWKSTKQTIFGTNYDKVILMRRNEDDSKKSIAHIQHYKDTKIDVKEKSLWFTGYQQDPNIEIPKWVDGMYDSGEKIYQEIIGMNINHIELTYENLYNEDRDIRKKELDKVIGEDKVHWLLHKNMLDNLHPQFKYTNQYKGYQKKDLL